MAFEKVLNLPPAEVIGQQTIFHCGPGSAENILVSLGIPADEWELAGACRTSENGTDWIGQIRDVLQQRAHHIDWRLIEMPNDPATPQEKQALWDNAVLSICEAGAPMLMNFVAPSSNYPRASRPSPIDGQVRNPSYGGGTVWHYVTCFGVAEDADGSRHMLIVDSGFQPQVYWITHDQCATLIPPKGYVFGHAERVGVPTLPGPAPTDLAPALADAMGNALTVDEYRALLPAVIDGLRAAQCTTPERIAHWFSQIGHESAGFRYMREIHDGSNYEGRADLGNVNPGDGVRYAGRSPIQITGASNYRQLSQWAHSHGYAPTPDYFLTNPEELEAATFAMLGPAWYWTVARGDQINQAADRGEAGIRDVSRLINGGDHGLDDRTNRYHNAIRLAPMFVAAVNEGFTPPPPPPPAARYWPMGSERVVTSPFGPRDGGHHSGVDFGVNGGSGGKPVYAIQSGKVMLAGEAAGYGGGEPGAGWLVIDSDDSQGGGVWEYGHIIAAPGIGVGSHVNAGDLIAAINPNQATNGGVAPHLHMAYMPREYNPNRKQDPLPVLEGALEPGAPEPTPVPAPEPVPPSLSPGTPLTGLPWHHSVDVNDRDLLLNIRAEGLLTQALVFAIAEKVGVNAREIYEHVRSGF